MRCSNCQEQFLSDGRLPLRCGQACSLAGGSRLSRIRLTRLFGVKLAPALRTLQDQALRQRVPLSRSWRTHAAHRRYYQCQTRQAISFSCSSKQYSEGHHHAGSMKSKVLFSSRGLSSKARGRSLTNRASGLHFPNHELPLAFEWGRWQIMFIELGQSFQGIEGRTPNRLPLRRRFCPELGQSRLV